MRWFNGVWSVFAVVVILFVIGTPFAMAQEATTTDEAPIVVDVAPDDVGGGIQAGDDGNSPTWYLLALGAVVFFATFAQYNLERMSGKSMRELSNSVPTHVVTLLLNGGSYLARLTETESDDKAVVSVGGKMGYVPSQLADGSILWRPPAPLEAYSPVETVANVADLAKTPNG